MNDSSRNLKSCSMDERSWIRSYFKWVDNQKGGGGLKKTVKKTTKRTKKTLKKG